MRQVILLIALCTSLSILMIGETLINDMTAKVYYVEAINNQSGTVMVFTTTDTTGVREIFTGYTITIK